MCIHEPTVTYPNHRKSRVILEFTLAVAHFMGWGGWVKMYIHHIISHRIVSLHRKYPCSAHPATQPCHHVLFLLCLPELNQGFQRLFSATLIWRKKKRKRKITKGALMSVPASCKEWVLRNIIGED